MDFKKIASTNRTSIKRSIARFCYIRKVHLTDEEFETLVRRTQDSGYRSAVKFLAAYFYDKNPKDIKQLLFQFTMEYNVELHCKQFPERNKAIFKIMNGERDPEQEIFFKEMLFDIIKANKLQKLIIDETVQNT